MKLWNIKNFVLNPESITLAQYLEADPQTGGRVLLIFVMGNKTPFEFVGEDAEYLYRILRSQSINVEARGRNAALPNE